MKEILLTQGKVALISDEDYDEISKYKWYVRYARGEYYAARNTPTINGKRNMIHMHRVIALTPKGFDTDHINGDTLDNRRENLRAVTHRLNNQNRKKHRAGALPGVTWSTRQGKWVANIQVSGKPISLGSYSDKFEAYNTYVNAVCETI